MIGSKGERKQDHRGQHIALMERCSERQLVRGTWLKRPYSKCVLYPVAVAFIELHLLLVHTAGKHTCIMASSSRRDASRRTITLLTRLSYEDVLRHPTSQGATSGRWF